MIKWMIICRQTKLHWILSLSLFLFTIFFHYLYFFIFLWLNIFLFFLVIFYNISINCSDSWIWQHRCWNNFIFRFNDPNIWFWILCLSSGSFFISSNLIFLCGKHIKLIILLPKLLKKTIDISSSNNSI